MLVKMNVLVEANGSCFVQCEGWSEMLTRYVFLVNYAHVVLGNIKNTQS